MPNVSRKHPKNTRTEDLLLHAVVDAVAIEVTTASRAISARNLTDENIHEARKCLKRARAGLRLLRSAFGDVRYRRENRQLRDAGRVLARLRDAKVLRAAVEDLSKRVRKNSQRTILDAHARLLKDERSEMERQARSRGGGLDRVRHELSNFSEEYGARALHGDRLAMCEGLRRTYRSGRHAMRKAEKTCAPDDMHEWRKQAKYLGQQLALLRELNTRETGAAIKRAGKIADELGTGHDFAVLSERLASTRPWCDDPHMPSLLKLLRSVRARYERKALRLGKKLYEHSPEKFARTYSRYLRAGASRS
jgi:CHAD domain-containing protein